MDKEYKLIVAGGRDFTDYDHMLRVMLAMVDHEFADKTLAIVSGMARGADALGVRLATDYKLPLYKFPANWNGLGKRAGFIRNAQMGDFADALLVFWDGQSKGTKNMVDYMHKLNKPVHIINY